MTLPVIYFFFKETKQKSLEEIDLLFGGRALGTLPEDLSGEVDVFNIHQKEGKSAETVHAERVA